jgi:putative hydrolase of the HAD superfamily
MGVLLKAVILDYGRVLCAWPPPQGYQELSRIAGSNGKLLEDGYWRFRDAYDRGKIDGPAYWRLVAEASGIQISSSQIEQLIAHDASLWMNVNREMVKWAGILKENGFKTAVLSNMPMEIGRFLRQAGDWWSQFTYVCFSAEVGLAKPDASIFHLCLEKLQTRPREALFIDDVEANVTAARALGLHAQWFESLERLRTDLHPFNLPPIPGANLA